MNFFNDYYNGDLFLQKKEVSGSDESSSEEESEAEKKTKKKKVSKEDKKCNEKVWRWLMCE